MTVSWVVYWVVVDAALVVMVLSMLVTRSNKTLDARHTW